MAEKDKDIELRRTAKLRLLQNPNYFGNLTDLKIDGLPKPVLKKVSDTRYEELTCIGYNPELDILTAIVRIKRGSGYSGGPCTHGSHEYVRFYLDYGDGTWVDHGVSSFNIHDLGFDDDLCYAVSIELDPRRRTCCDRDPVLPNVRAILSWNIEPPADTPGWLPVWGNRLERDIQIEPRSPFLCTLIDSLTDAGIKKIDPALLNKATELLEFQPPVPKPVAPLTKLVREEESKEELATLRNVFPAIAKLAADQTDIAAYKALEALKPLEIDISKFDDFLLKPNFNTTYEELHCVGLDRDLSYLHGVVEIKRASGYSGDLCTQGSREWIAFYIEFGGVWVYMGTTWVDVHNISQIPAGGLWYQAILPVNLEPYQLQWCETRRVRVRGILSWAAPPPPNDPDYIATWGDREDCDIEVRPLPNGVAPGQVTPVLETIGAMPVDLIDATGFANGPSIGATFTADDSPFGGVIKFTGVIAFPTSNNLEYRVMVQGPGDVTPKPWTKSFTVNVTTIVGGSISFSSPTQNAAGDWYEYIPQTGAVFKSVAENLLARFTATEEGLHTVYLEIREAGSAIILATSATEAFFVDNTRPSANVEITSGAGNCGKFTIGEVLVGTYAMADLHSHSLSLTVTPSDEAAGGTLAITSVVPAAPLPAPLPGPTASNGLSYAGLTLTTTGASGNWELDTTGMDPCGYNIRLRVEDRTIVNSGFIGWANGDIEGFCLEHG